MKQNENRKDICPGLVGSIQPGDGLDPRFDRTDSKKGSKKDGYKASQLCTQVRSTLELAVPEALANSIYDVVVIDVQSAPNTTNLLVLVQSTLHCNDLVELQNIESALASKAGFLRSTVAHAISRRKAPNLIFRVVPS